jgi:phenylacetate-CoA ligase
MQNPCLAFPSINDLVKYLEKSQYTHINTYIPKGQITTKEDLQKITILPNQPISRTSGSTGTPVTVPKTPESMMWYMATNIRELQWRKWDFTKKIVSFLARNKVETQINNMYHKKLDTVQNIQKYLEELQPNYIYTYPTIIEKLDLTKLNELIDIKTVGEVGGTNYSSEEAGTIALQCPDYSEVYHIMENIVVETHPEYGVLVTDLTNPIINRYVQGDVVELGGPCKCGRTLPTIKKIYGRIRNMLVLPNGDKIWPLIGEPQFMTITNKIIRHQAIQRTLNDIELCLQVKEILTINEENKLIKLVLSSLGYDHLNCKIVYVDGFKEGKFEIFKCEIN